jgi:hypothetical protein
LAVAQQAFPPPIFFLFFSFSKLSSFFFSLFLVRNVGQKTFECCGMPTLDRPLVSAGVRQNNVPSLLLVGKSETRQERPALNEANDPTLIGWWTLTGLGRSKRGPARPLSNSRVTHRPSARLHVITIATELVKIASLCFVSCRRFGTFQIVLQFEYDT